MPHLEFPLHRRILVIAAEAGDYRRVRNMLAAGPRSGGNRHAQSSRSNQPDVALEPQPVQYIIDLVADGESAVSRVTEAIACHQPYELALADLPAEREAAGLETLQHIWELDQEIQTILCLSPNALEMAQILEPLGVSDRVLILRQPYQEVELRSLALVLTQKWRAEHQLRITLKNQSEHIRDAARVVEIIDECERELADSRDDLQVQTTQLSNQLKQRVDEILGTRDVMVFALERLAESRDAETGEHLERMRAYSQILAEELSEHGPFAHEIDSDFLRNFALSTPLHDIGKVGVPDRILRKPSRLDTDEFDIMRQHTLIGAEALRAAAHQSIYGEFLLMAAEIAKSHHERFDGTGYPQGLAGADIPLAARIVAVADVFDALTSRRVYKDEQAAHEARKIIVAESGTHFDPHVVAAFERRFQDFLQVKTNNLTFDSIQESILAPS